MTNVASLELSRELYELSHWDGKNPNTSGTTTFYVVDNELKKEVACYDLSYLLRKLPDDNVNLMKIGSKWFAWVGIDFGMDGKKDSIADTPEDCVAKLVIALFKAGVLK